MMEQRLYTISVTKAEVEWVLNKTETEVNIDMLESRLTNYKEEQKETVATVKRMLVTLGYDPFDKEKKYDFFNDEWWMEFEAKFNKERG